MTRRWMMTAWICNNLATGFPSKMSISMSRRSWKDANDGARNHVTKDNNKNIIDNNNISNKNNNNDHHNNNNDHHNSHHHHH